MQYLDKAGFNAEAIHGNKSQNARQQTLENFRNGRSSVLVATDIASRGIDIDDVTHVFNYELPHEPESYVHRIGRTARKGTEGVAISLCDPGERAQLRSIERLLKQSIPVAGAANDDKPRTDGAMPKGSAASQQRNGKRHNGAKKRTPQGEQEKKAASHKNAGQHRWRRRTRRPRRQAA
jgi:ATP-dependent RNA helicase RhlE